MRSTRELLRIARCLQAIYEQRATQAIQEQLAHWRLLEERCRQMQQHHCLIEQARSRGWHLAALKLQQHLQSMLRVFSEVVRETQQKWVEPQHPCPRLKDLCSELQHLDAEFEAVIMDKEGNLTVETPPIVLEGIHLGRFSLRLHWPGLAQHADVDCFEVVALDPHPSAVNEDVTHPHVKHDHLCAGDATLPLQRALEQGRLTDAFHLIRSVLETYNPHSAYVSLDEWEGFVCWDCGNTTDDDDRCFCPGCEHDLCCDCCSPCQRCDTVLCASCQSRCEVCEDACCPHCLKTSASSETRCCADCLRVCNACKSEIASNEFDAASELCPSCLEAPASKSTITPDTSGVVPVSTP